MLTYIIGLLIASSLMLAWFESTAPIHVFMMLKKLGYKKQATHFWKQLGTGWDITWTDWADAISIHLPPFVSTLLTCRFCLSFHVAFYTAIVLTFYTNQDWTFIPACTLSWPILINILLNRAK